MKRLFWGVFLLPAMLSGTGKEIVRSDFSGTADFTKQWKQSTSGYYQPLGKVEQTPEGLKLSANSKTAIIVGQKESFPIGEGDRIELTLNLKCAKDAYVYLGVYEYSNRDWSKNDIAEFWVKPGTETVTKTITIKPGKKPVNRGAVIFGAGTGKEIMIRSVSARFAGVDPAQAVSPCFPKGLAVHLDGSRPGAVELENGRVKRWGDLSGNGYDAVAEEGEGPVYLESGVNRLPMVRFSGKQEMKTVKPLNLPSGITVFVLFRREAAQKGESWQDSLYWGDGKVPDNTGSVHLTMGANGGEEFPKIFQNMNPSSVGNPLRIGANAGKRGFLTGDVGEIIVFGRTDLNASEIEQVRSWMLKKWNVNEDDYVRFGPLPPGAPRVTDAYPLSDQKNLGNWHKVERGCDEFNGGELDRSKWTDQVFYTLGNAPVRTLPDNLKIKDGMARITTIYDPGMPSGRLTPRGPEYHSFSTGMLQSLFLFRYGYIEIRAKIQPTSFNNAFWLIGRGVEHATGRDVVPEIDVFELAGKSFAHSNNYNMALHCVQHKPVPKHDHFGKTWKSDFKFTDDFHVYGLEWTPKTIRYFIDGVLVRQFIVKENYWDLPMTVHFSCCPHFDWFGVPAPADFPCTYFIDYFRLWKNPATDLPDDWEKKYKITHQPRTKGFAYDYYRKNGNKIVPDPKAPPAPKESHGLNMIGEAARWQSFFGASAGLESPAKGEKEALLLTFPAVASRRDSGEVQYAAPSSLWPRVEFSGAAMNIADWTPYQYLAIDFLNPNRGVEACTLKVTLKNDRTVQQGILLRNGKGTVYWPLPDGVKGSPVKNLMISVRGSDRTVRFYLTGFHLEK